MSKANETNQTKPDFKINDCFDCPAEETCFSTLNDPSCHTVRKKIETLVNRK